MSYGIKGEDTFIPAGAMALKLPAGMYEVKMHPFTGPYFTRTQAQTDELLDIPGTTADSVMTDIRGFLEKKSEYAKYGFAHKRGYLLYGPPGTGKTSIAQLVARRFVQDGGIVLILPSPVYLPLGLQALDTGERGRNVLALMEDPKEGDLDAPEVLAVLDGTRAVSGLVSLVTTNYKSKMPPRLANRPGRFDRIVLVDRISKAIQLAYLENLQSRDASGPAPAQAVVDALDGIPLTLAHLKEAFLSHVILGTPLVDIRARFEAMASMVNDDDGVEGKAQTSTSDADYDIDAPAPIAEVQRDARINLAKLIKG